MQTDRGARVPFDRLLIASGADPRRLGVDGANSRGVFTLRKAEDVRRILGAIESTGHALVLGGGLVGQDRVRIDAGIVVNDHLRTNVEAVYAAGDVAEHFDHARGERWVNAIWPVAVEMGRMIAVGAASHSEHGRDLVEVQPVWSAATILASSRISAT